MKYSSSFNWIREKLNLNSKLILIELMQDKCIRIIKMYVSLQLRGKYYLFF